MEENKNQKWKKPLIIWGSAATAIVALVIGLSVGLSEFTKGNASNGNSISSTSKASESSSSKGDDKGSSSSTSSSTSTHTHTWGTTLQIMTKASKTTVGKKAYQCTSCQQYDTEHEVEYTPYIDSYNWDDVIKFSGDYETSETSFEYEGSLSYYDRHHVISKARHGDVTKIHDKETSYDNTRVMVDSYLYYTKENDKFYKIKDYHGSVLKSEITEDVYNNAVDLDFSDLGEKNDYINNFNETDSSYEIKDTDGNVTKKVYFDLGKVIQIIETPDEDNGGAYHNYEITHSSDEVHAVCKTLDLNSTTKTISSECVICGEKYSSIDYNAGDSFDKVIYGYYPQSYVSDTTISGLLDNIVASGVAPNSAGYYTLNEEYYYRYSATTFASDYKFSDGTTIVSGTNYWFKVEPVEWKLFQTKDDTYTLLTSKLLEAHTYSTTSGEKSNVYDVSEIRRWMNAEFFDRIFYKDSGSYVEVTEVDNSAATTLDSDENSCACDNTNDKVYSLSYQDYYSDYFGYDDDDSRICSMTDFAKATGAKVYDEDKALYWTRSPDDFRKDNAWIVGGDDGDLTYVGAKWDAVCVRPAVSIKF